LQQSLEIAQKLKSPSDIGAALLSLGNTAYSQQDAQAALKFFNKRQMYLFPQWRVSKQN
jgi:hypothetical protein